MKKLEALISAFPYLTGLIFFIPLFHLPDPDSLTLFSYYLLLFLLWNALENRVFLSAANSKGMSAITPKTKMDAAIIILLMLFIVFNLHLVRERVGEASIMFYAILFLLGSNSLISYFEKREKIYLALFVRLAHYVGVGYISFSILAGGWLWQPLGLSLSVASQSLAVACLSAITETSSADTRRNIVRAHNLMLVLAPMSIATMVFLSNLPRSYLGLFLLFPIIARVINSSERSLTDPIAFNRSRAISSLLTISFVLLCAILGLR